MRNKIFIGILTLLAQITFNGEAHAQVSPTRLMIKADSCRLAYSFEEAVKYSEGAIEILDSTASAKAEEQLLMARNGLNMMGFCSQPTVVAKRTFPLRDFFLFYPLKDFSWRKTPNQLDSLGGDDLSRAIYIPRRREGHLLLSQRRGGHQEYLLHTSDGFPMVRTGADQRADDQFLGRDLPDAVP